VGGPQVGDNLILILSLAEGSEGLEFQRTEDCGRPSLPVRDTERPQVSAAESEEPLLTGIEKRGVDRDECFEVDVVIVLLDRADIIASLVTGIQRAELRAGRSEHYRIDEETARRNFQPRRRQVLLCQGQIREAVEAGH